MTTSVGPLTPHLWPIFGGAVPVVSGVEIIVIVRLISCYIPADRFFFIPWLHQLYIAIPLIAMKSRTPTAQSSRLCGPRSCNCSAILVPSPRVPPEMLGKTKEHRDLCLHVFNYKYIPYHTITYIKLQYNTSHVHLNIFYIYTHI